MATSAIRFSLSEKSGAYWVTARVDDAPSCEEEFDVELSAGSRLAGVIDKIDENRCQLDDLKDLGIHLWNGLVSGQISNLVKKVRADLTTDGVCQLRLDLPPELARIPWECLYDERDNNFLATERRYAIIREGVGSVRPAQPPRDISSDRLNVLVVIPMGTGLDAEREWNNIKTELQRFENINVEKLVGRVDPNQIDTALQRGEFDVFHFIGHGEVADDGGASVRLNAPNGGISDEHLMGADAFRRLFDDTSIRLVFLNCCLAGVARRFRSSLSGVGPHLLSAGVRAVIAMQYEIVDDEALLFARFLYQQLMSKNNPGSICRALTAARRKVQINQHEGRVRGFITPLCYLASEDESLFVGKPLGSSIGLTRVEPAAEPPGVEVPEELVEIVREGRCIPIVGPLMLAQELTRSSKQAPGPRPLARYLASKAAYPDEDDFKLVKWGGPWLDNDLLARVCQFYEHQPQHQRFRLVDEIRSIYSGTQIPGPMNELASWRMPGIVSLFFDGLLAEAMTQNHPVETSLVNTLEMSAELSDRPTLVINLRGSWDEIESLVLTEEDHERLWERVGRLPHQLLELITEEAGRSLLVLGACPPDPLLRHFCNQLLNPETTRNRGPIFFVTAQETMVDEAYWARHRPGVQWIHADPEDVINRISFELNSEDSV